MHAPLTGSAEKCADRELNHDKTVLLAPLDRCADCDLPRSILSGALVAHESFAEECADRELNPGYELGKLMSYH